MKQPTPAFTVTMGGKDLTSLMDPRLVSLTINECRADEADTLTIVLNDADGRLALPKRGAVLAVSIGWDNEDLVDKGTFTINELEYSGAPDIITMQGRSASMTKGMGERQEKSWHLQTLGAIVKAIAAKHKLNPVVSDKLAKIAIPHIDQTHESDMSFLTRLAKRYDAVMTVKEDNLLFMPIGLAVTASGKPLPTVKIFRDSGDQYRYHVSERENYAGVRAFYHSTGRAKRKSVIVGGENNINIKVLPETYATEAEAIAAAQSEMTRTQRGQATMNYTIAYGRSYIRPEMPAIVSGFKPEIDETDWLIKRASHTISDQGFLTNVELEMLEDPTTKRHRSHFRKPG